MSPLIPVGAIITIRKINENESLKKYDILLFKNGQRLVCHYFWRENQLFDKGFIITRSIKNMTEDLPFSKTQVLGVVTNFKIGPWLKIKMHLRDILP